VFWHFDVHSFTFGVADEFECQAGKLHEFVNSGALAFKHRTAFATDDAVLFGKGFD